MAGFVKGDVVVVNYPNSATPDAKRRPALVLASWPYESSRDYLLCMISCQSADDPYIMQIQPDEFAQGALSRTSYLRPTYMYACSENLIAYKACELKPEVLERALDAIRRVLA